MRRRTAWPAGARRAGRRWARVILRMPTAHRASARAGLWWKATAALARARSVPKRDAG